VAWLYIGTQEIRFGRKTNEIAKFRILEEKAKFTILDEIWTKNGQLIAEKLSNSFTFIGITIMLLQLG